MHLKLPKFFFLLLLLSLLLTACSSKWVQDVDLAPEERASLEHQVEKLRSEIKYYDGPEGSIPYNQIVKLARAYSDLGNYKAAINLYIGYLEDGSKSIAMTNNLGRLYEKVEEYDLAIEQYQKLIDEYNEPNYLYDITRAYIRKGDWRNAEKYFNAWQLEFQRTDTQVQEEIKQLRAEEKAAE